MRLKQTEIEWYTNISTERQRKKMSARAVTEVENREEVIRKKERKVKVEVKVEVELGKVEMKVEMEVKMEVEVELVKVEVGMEEKKGEVMESKKAKRKGGDGTYKTQKGTVH